MMHFRNGFPEALKYKVIDGKLSDIPSEPIAGDFREGKDGRARWKAKINCWTIRSSIR